MNMYPTIEELKSNPIMAILTGHTCGEACWHAREKVCRCSCGGKNHGILNNGLPRPERTSKKDGKFYTLAGVAPSYGEADKMLKEVLATSFPGIDYNAYGDYRDASTMPVMSRKASDGALKWPEVAAVTSTGYHGDKYLIWRLPAGSRYITKGSSSAITGSIDGKYDRPAIATVYAVSE